MSLNRALWHQLLPLLPLGTLPSDSLWNDPAGELDGVELILRVEKRFAIRIPDLELAQLQTIGDLVQVVERNASPLVKWVMQQGQHRPAGEKGGHDR